MRLPLAFFTATAARLRILMKPFVCERADDVRSATNASTIELAPTVRHSSLRSVDGCDAYALWRELVGRYHYLGNVTARCATALLRAGPAGRVPPIVGCLQ